MDLTKFKNIPNAAFHFAERACFSLQERIASGGGLKVHLKARSKDSINHWYFGKVIHDFSTLSLPSKIAIDDSHGDEIGRGVPVITAWGLEIDCEIFPNDKDPSHAANRIIYNLSNEIPQEASIDFSGDYDMEILAQDQQKEVNGKLIEGEAVIIKNWSLRACAICKEGADPNSSAETFSNKKYNLKNLKVTEMANEKGEKKETQSEQVPPGENSAGKTQGGDNHAEQFKAINEKNEQLTQSNKTLADENKDLKEKLSAAESKISAFKNSKGTDPVGMKPASGEEKTLAEQFMSLSGEEKTLFYQKHKSELSKEFRRSL